MRSTSGSIELDGTPTKSRLGANAILGCSLASAKAAAADAGQPLYRWLGGDDARTLPVPLMNVINGGAHAQNRLDLQEFMVVPAGAETFSEALRIGAEVFHSLKAVLHERGLATGVGDEGGFAPDLESTTSGDRGDPRGGGARGASRAHRDRARPGGERGVPRRRVSPSRRGPHARPGRDDRVLPLARRSLPARLDRGRARRERLERLARLTEAIGDDVQLVGDDLFVTNVEFLRRGIDERVANAILVKVNQIGTLTESLDVIEMARGAGYATVISHRSGETEDTTIADLAVAVNAGQIKTGAPSRTDRVAKYNQLLRIEEELGDEAAYPGWSAFRGR